MPEWGLVLLGGGVGIVGAAIGAGIGFYGQYLTTKKQEENKFRLAAVERRLEVAQEACRRASEFASLMNDKSECHAFSVECTRWWNENCLYLASGVRESFKSCLNVAQLASDPKSKEDQQVRRDILMLRPRIEISVGLPELGMPEPEKENTDQE